jgi:hypothetical protein
MSAEEAELENLAIRYGGEMGYRAGQQGATVAGFQGAVAKQKRRQRCKLAPDRCGFGVVVWQDTNITGQRLSRYRMRHLALGLLV